MYTPNNLQVYTYALAGSYAGLTGVGRGLLPAASSDAVPTQIAGAYAQELDSLWGTTSPTVVDLQNILLFSMAAFSLRGPSSTSPLDYGAIANGVVSACVEAEVYLAGQGIPSYTIGGTIYGTGQDGAAVLDGVATYPFATLAGSTYTLTRDVFLASASVLPGITLKPAGFHEFCTGTFQVAAGAFVLADGNPAALGVPGAATALGTLGIGTAGGAGGVNGVGTHGVNQANTLGDASAAGGAGGAGGANGGGAGGTYVASPTNGGANYLVSLLTGFLFSQTSGGNQAQLNIIGGGAGGGGGGSDNGGVVGGAGGGGAAVLHLACGNLVNNGTIRAQGGAGAAASGAGGNGGGGGGGGGGIIINLFGSKSGTGTMTAPGGAGAAGIGTGVAGADGSAGHVNSFQQRA